MVSFRLLPNSVRVLHKIDGLLESLESSHFSKIIAYSVVEEDKRILVARDVPPPPDGLRTLGVGRSALNKSLIAAVARTGVDIKWNHKLVTLEQQDEGVSLIFENGYREWASFAIGCDGLHSNTRSCLFGQQRAEFSGIVQVMSVYTGHLEAILTLPVT